MLQAAAIGATPPLSRPSAAGAPSGAARYADDWAAVPVAARPAAAAPLPPAANDTDLTARAKTDALLSADVYHDVASPPAGVRLATTDDLHRLNLKPEMLELPGSSFRARVYVEGQGADERYVVAFRGSQTGEDWKNNFQQAAGLDSASYAKALRIGQALARSDAEVRLTGHSLGGGLASAAAVASGREADTFNAAGLSDRTLGDARAIASGAGRGGSAVQAYHVPGEILTAVQEGGDRAIGFVLGGVPGAVLADAPAAYGTHHALPNVRPEGKSFLDSISPVDRHKIDWVLAGAAALR